MVTQLNVFIKAYFHKPYDVMFHVAYMLSYKTNDKYYDKCLNILCFFFNGNKNILRHYIIVSIDTKTDMFKLKNF